MNHQRRFSYRSSCHQALAWAFLVLGAAGPALAAVSWGPSGVEGGGFQNVLALQPGGTGVMLSGADVAGLQRTTNYGLSWRPVNLGTPAFGPSKIAALAFSNDPQRPNTVYAGAGDKGTGGGFFVSTDGGLTWRVPSTVPKFSGNGEANVEGLPGGMPRSTGNLIAPDETGATKYLYAATFRDGVLRSTSAGASWASVGLSNKFLRSLLLDPNAPSVLYAAAYSNKVWKTAAARTTTGTGTAGWCQLANSPEVVEEMMLIGSTLYAVGRNAGQNGLWKSTDGGTNWIRLGAAALAPGSEWSALAGYAEGAGQVLYVGACSPVQQGTSGWYPCIFRSTDSGNSWTALTLGANVVNQVGGPGGRPWWVLGAVGNYKLGKPGYDCAMLQIDPANRERVFSIGRSGIWGTTNATAATVLWYPLVAGLSVTVNNWVATDPHHPERVYVANTDYRFLCSRDHGATFDAMQPPGSSTSGKQIVVDPIDSTVYAAIGNRDENIGGEIFSNPDPNGPANQWTDEGLSAAAGGKRARGLAVGRDSTGNTRVLLAAVEGDGLYRKVGTGSWTLINTSISPGAGSKLQFAWNRASSNVFLFDQNTGLWRSTDSGVTWSKIWAHPSPTTRTGYVVEDPAQEGRLYVSAADGVYRLAGAHQGVAVGNGIAAPVAMGGPADPGPLALANGILYACDRVAGGHDARLYQWLSPATSTAAVNLADPVMYPSQAGWPSGLAVSADNYIYSSQNSDGVIVGIPASPPAPAHLQASAGLGRVALAWNAVATATSYKVKRAMASGGPYTTVASLSATNWTDSGVSHAAAYYYVVTAVNAAGESGLSGEALATPPLNGSDIGAVGLAGSHAVAAGTWTLSGSGGNIYSTGDLFYFAWLAWTGDVEVMARVAGIQNTHYQAKAAVMVRESLAANSVHAMADVTPGYGLEFSRRPTTGGKTTVTVNSGLAAPYWVRLSRTGNSITAFRSSDGANWLHIGTDTVPMASQVYVGLAVCAHDNTQLCTATFDRFAVAGPAPTLAMAAAGSNLSLSWAADAGLFSLHTTTNLVPPVQWRRAAVEPVLSNGQWRATLPLPTNGQCYYHLATP